MVDESDPITQLTWEAALALLNANFAFRTTPVVGDGISYRLKPNGQSLLISRKPNGFSLDLPISVPFLEEVLPSPGLNLHRYIVQTNNDLELVIKQFRDVDLSETAQDFLPVPLELPPIPEGVEAIQHPGPVGNQRVGIGMFGRLEGATLTELRQCCNAYLDRYKAEGLGMPENTAEMTKSKIQSHWQWTSTKTRCNIQKMGKVRGREPVFGLAKDMPATDTLKVEHENDPMTKNFENQKVLYQEAINTILYGPPGTGKTYKTAEIAVTLCNGSASSDRKELMKQYEELRKDGRISFVTFHQSYGYEEFVEGLRPEVKDGQVAYSVRPGIFQEVCSAAKRSQLVKPGISGKPLAQRKIFKMSLGVAGSPEGKLAFQDSISNGVVLLGWGDDVDFSECDGSTSIKQKVKEYPGMENPDAQARYISVFKEELEVGDIIVVSQGNTAFRAIGEVIGEYEYLEEPLASRFHQSRAVRWIAVFEGNRPVDEIYNRKFMQSSLYKLSPEHLKAEALEALVNTQSGLGIQNFVLVIDEINRANISKVFGELITLLEPDKREGKVNAVTLRLPYSGHEFSVPANLHVIGTMNTADRSIALLDTALRRRFDFEELAPDPTTLAGKFVDGVDLEKMLVALNDRIEALYDRDHKIGHAFFLGITSHESLENVFRRKVLPLLQEYFYENWSNVRRVLNDYGDGDFVTRKSLKPLRADGDETYSEEARVVYNVNNTPFPVAAYQRIYAQG